MTTTTTQHLQDQDLEQISGGFGFRMYPWRRINIQEIIRQNLPRTLRPARPLCPGEN